MAFCVRFFSPRPTQSLRCSILNTYTRAHAIIIITATRVSTINSSVFNGNLSHDTDFTSSDMTTPEVKILKSLRCENTNNDRNNNRRYAAHNTRQVRRSHTLIALSRRARYFTRNIAWPRIYNLAPYLSCMVDDFYRL